MSFAIDRQASRAPQHAALYEASTGMYVAVVCTVYIALTVLITWPAAATLREGLWGARQDPWQTLWDHHWWRTAPELGQSRFFTRELWWPTGVPLWFETWDIPSAVLFAPFGRFSPFLSYNLAVLTTFPLSGLTCCLLCRELGQTRLASALSGVLYSFSVYHVAHAQAQLHIASMHWSPLVVLLFIKAARAESYFIACLCGAALGVTCLASTYHFVFAIVTCGILTMSAGLSIIGRLAWKQLRLLLTVAVVSGCVCGWLLTGMLLNALSEPYERGHESLRFSADIQSFILPTPTMIWSKYFDASKQWTGSGWEDSGYEACSYIGIGVLGLCVAAGWRGSKVTRGFLLVAAVGMVMAIGPRLQVGGRIFNNLAMPYGLLQELSPVADFSGMPVRWSWLTTFGVAVAAGSALNRLNNRGWVGSVLAILVTAATVVETWPKPFTTYRWPTPPVIGRWASDKSEWAVLDGTQWSRAMWHQMLHGHPIVGGAITRTPIRLRRQIASHPVFRALSRPPIGPPNDGPPLNVPNGQAQKILTDAQVRFVIADESRERFARLMGLTERCRFSGVVIFEVPRFPGPVRAFEGCD